MFKINDITNMANHVLLPYIKEAKVAVDCTCGNGYDSAYILLHLSEDASLFCFDIQEQAIISTKEKLDSIQSPCRNFSVIKDSHAKIDEYIENAIDIAMFNLGYLPGTDHAVTTRSDSTIQALEKILTMLSKGGLISIIIYSGHESGKIERSDLLDFFHTIDDRIYKLMNISYPHSPNNPPEIFIIQKVK